MSIMLAAADLVDPEAGTPSVGDCRTWSAALGVPEDRECAILVALGYPSERGLEPSSGASGTDGT